MDGALKEKLTFKPFRPQLPLKGEKMHPPLEQSIDENQGSHKCAKSYIISVVPVLYYSMISRHILWNDARFTSITDCLEICDSIRVKLPSWIIVGF